MSNETNTDDIHDYRFVVQFSHPSQPGEMGHTTHSTFDTRHEAVGWMANRMRENPTTTYRLDVYDRAKAERVEKGTPRRDGSEDPYPPGVPTPADEVVQTSDGPYILRVGDEPIPVRNHDP